MSRPASLVGRDPDVALLRELVAEVAAGRGGAAWIEGEPGIGKTTLLDAVTGDVERTGCQLFRARGDELGQRFPLRVLLEAFHVTDDSHDPGRAEIAALLRSEGSGLAGGDPVVPAAERLLAFIDRLCVAAPVVLVLDDFQWADDASVAVWARLARSVRQLPLLLVSAARPAPGRRELSSLRRSMVADGAAYLPLKALSAEDSAGLAGTLLGREADARLLRLVQRASGNPLYIREIVDALAREKPGGADEPASLGAAIADRLGFLSDDTAGVLRIAALLGSEFTVTDLATVAGRGALDLVPVVEEGLATGVLSESGVRFAFRHALIRQALTEAVPAGLRSALHLQAAQALIGARASMERVVEQLLAAEDLVRSGAGWVVDWLVDESPRLVYRAPQLAAELLGRVLEQLPADDPYREVFDGYLVTAAWLDSRDDAVERHARQVLARSHDPVRRARASWTLAYVAGRTGRYDESIAVTEAALADERTDQLWNARLSAMRSMSLSSGSRYDEAEAAATEALAVAERVGDGFSAGYALHALAQIRIRTERKSGTLAILDRALAVMGDDADTGDLRLMTLTNRAFAFEALDKMADAVAAAREAVRATERSGSRGRRAVSRVMLAEILYHAGQWDDVVAELERPERPYPWLESPYPGLTILQHGLLAMVAAHRDDTAAAARDLGAVAALGFDPGENRLNARYVIWAQALLAERAGEPRQALDLLGQMLGPDWHEGSSSRLWLPYAVRLALAEGDTGAAREIADRARAESLSDGAAGWGSAVGRCEGLLDGDARPVLAAADHYRAAGRLVELADTLEDAAVLLAEHGDAAAAKAALDEAVELYTALGAHWDIRRASARVRPFGLRRGQRGPRRRPTSGWDALTPTETRVAAMIAEGKSNPDIATVMFLSRRTVQTHVSHILAKLDAHSRIEIAAEAGRHLTGPGTRAAGA